MDVLKKLKEDVLKKLAWESFYFTVTGNHIYDDFPEFKDVLEDRKKSLETFMRNRPGKISWVDLAVAAYLCGEEDIFDELSEKMRSPKGMCNILLSMPIPWISLLMLVQFCCYACNILLFRSNFKLSCSESTTGETPPLFSTVCWIKC